MTFAYLPGYLQYPVMRQARQRGVQLEPPSTHLFVRGGLRSTFSHSKVASAAWPFGCPRTNPGESLLPLGLGLGIISLREPGRGGPSAEPQRAVQAGAQAGDAERRWRRWRGGSRCKSLSGQTHTRGMGKKRLLSLSGLPEIDTAARFPPLCWNLSWEVEAALCQTPNLMQKDLERREQKSSY